MRHGEVLLPVVVMTCPSEVAAVLSSEPVLPPLDGSVWPMVTGLIDFHETNNPERPWAFLASDRDASIYSVTYREFARATHRVAHALRPGRLGPENEVVGLLIECDSVLYVALLAGMIRAGLIVSTASVHNAS